MTGKKKILAVLLAAIMVLSSMTAIAYAEDAEGGEVLQPVELTADDIEVVPEGEALDPEETIDLGSEAVVELEASGFPITVNLVGATSIRVSWDPLENATAYIAYIQGEQEGTLQKLGTECTATFNDLTSGNSYVIAVEATITDPETLEESTEVALSAVITCGGWDKSVENFVSYPDSESVTLTWDSVPGAERYALYYKPVDEDEFVLESDKLTGNEYRIFADKYIVYDYQLYAINGNGEQSAVAAEARNQRVRKACYNIKTTVKKSLTCHCCKKKKGKVVIPKGTNLVAEGFGGGRYRFLYTAKDGKVHTFWIARLSAYKGAKIDYYIGTEDEERYADGYPYKTAENFVNHNNWAANKKAPNSLIWASLYTQTVYVFEGGQGNWHVVKSFKCASGKAATPSPVGTSLKLGQHIRRLKARNYWTTFSSLNSFHGLKGKEVAGKVLSHGCIRLYDADAKYIYTQMKLGTHVVVF